MLLLTIDNLFYFVNMTSGHVVEIDMRQVDGKVTQGHLIIAAGEDQEVDQGELDRCIQSQNLFLSGA